MTSIGSILKQQTRPIKDSIKDTDRFSLTPAGYAALAATEPNAPADKTADKPWPPIMGDYERTADNEE